MMRKIGFAILILCLSFQYAFSQRSYADKLYDEKNYGSAANMYEKVVDKGKEDDLLKVIERAAFCFKMVNNYEKAEKFYGMAVQMGSKKSDSYLNYGQLLKNNGNINQAKSMFEKFLEMEPNDEKGLAMLKSCEFITKWASEPTEFSISSVDALNSANSDINAVPYGGNIVFTSDKNYEKRDKKGKFREEYDGLSYSIFIYDEDNKDDPIRSISEEINSTGDIEGPAYFSKNQNIMFYTKVFKNESKTENQLEIHAAKLVEGKWVKDENLIKNHKMYSFSNPVISPDMSTIYFSSDRPGTAGGFDIWYSDLSSSEIGVRINKMGDIINTPGNEIPSYVDKDGVLYFSSDYHPGFGGTDIFWTKKDGDTWTKPENLKLPFNSTKDDFGYYPLTEESGYLSSNRDGGKGKDDIYFYSKKSFSDSKNYTDVRGVYEIAGKPLQNISLILLDENKQIVRTTKTSETGNFEFKTVSTDQKYHILIDENLDEILEEANIFLTDENEKRKIINKLQKGLFQFDLLQSDEADDLELLPEFDESGMPTIVIMGHLNSKDASKNLNDKKVYVIDENGNIIASTFTDRLGNFKFEKLSMDDEYLFKLDEEDFDIDIEIINKEGVVIGRTMKNKDGQYVYHKFTINPSANPDIRGVYKYGTLPADGVTLMLIDENDQVVQFVTTGSQGEFAFSKLNAGQSYHIRPKNTETIPENSNLYLLDSHTGIMMPVSKLANGSFKFETLAPLPPEELELMAEEDFVFEPRNHLLGWVSNKETNVNPSNLDIELVDASGKAIAHARTDEKGEFRFYNVLSSEEYLFSIPKNDPNYEISIIGGNDAKIGIAKRNEKNQFVYHKFTINPSKKPDIRGVFKYGTLPANGVQLNLLDEADNVITFAKTNSSGEFKFTNLQAGKEYHIAPDASAGEIPENAVLEVVDSYTGLLLPVSKLANGSFKFETLAPMETDDLELMEEEDVSITKFSLFAHLFSKLPMDIPEGLEIFILDDEGNVIATAKTDQFGKFNFDQLPMQEEYIMKISEDDPNFQLRVLDKDGNELGVIKRGKDGNFIYNPKELEKVKAVKPKPAANSTYNISADLIFDLNSSLLTDKTKNELADIVSFLKENQASKIEVTSHTDAQGEAKYNMWLSERRSNTIKKYLTEQGINQSRITTKFFGESKLLNECADGVDCPPEKHAENRRTEVRFY